MICTQLPTMLPPTLPALHFELFSQWNTSERRDHIAACLFRANHVSHKISAGDRAACFNIIHGHQTNFFMSWPRLALCSCFCTPRRSSVVSVMLIFNIVQRSCAFNVDPVVCLAFSVGWCVSCFGGCLVFCCTLRRSSVPSAVLTFKGITQGTCSFVARPIVCFAHFCSRRFLVELCFVALCLSCQVLPTSCCPSVSLNARAPSPPISCLLRSFFVYSVFLLSNDLAASKTAPCPLL